MQRDDFDDDDDNTPSRGGVRPMEFSEDAESSPLPFSPIEPKSSLKNDNDMWRLSLTTDPEYGGRGSSESPRTKRSLAYSEPEKVFVSRLPSLDNFPRKKLSPNDSSGRASSPPPKPTLLTQGNAFTLKSGGEDDLRADLGWEPYIVLKMPTVAEFRSGQVPQYRGYNLYRPGRRFDPHLEPVIIANITDTGTVGYELHFRRTPVDETNFVPGIDDVMHQLFTSRTGGFDDARTLFRVMAQPGLGGRLSWNIVATAGSRLHDNFFGVHSSFDRIHVILVCPDRIARVYGFTRL